MGLHCLYQVICRKMRMCKIELLYLQFGIMVSECSRKEEVKPGLYNMWWMLWQL